MPNEDAHIETANRNQETIEYLLKDRVRFSPWIATVALYKALHVVEAVFYAVQGAHTESHDRREDLLKKTHKYQNIYKHYAPLMRASKVARYLEDRGVDHVTFSDWMTPDEVVTDLLNDRLKQIENSARKFLKAQDALRTWTASV